jgi:hypothetical protein
VLNTVLESSNLSSKLLNTGHLYSRISYHLRLSGNSMVNPRTIRAKMIWNPIGNLYAIVLGSRNEKPKSSQYDKQMLPVISAPSIIAIIPLRCALEVSDCQLGTVDVLIPLPTPMTTRPTMK